jgi:hypothetical protein
VGPVSNEVPESAIAAQPEAQNPNNTEALQKLVEHFAFRYRHIGQRKNDKTIPVDFPPIRTSPIPNCKK